MNTKLERLFESIEVERTKLHSRLETHSEEILNWKLSPDKWSINQIMTHLFISEKLSLGYMRKKSLGIDSFDNSGLLESIKLKILIVSQRLPFKYKAPKILAQKTPEALILSDLNNQWLTERTELKSFLESMQDKHIRKKIYKHPVVGMLDVVQAITFFREHIYHHKPQIDSILKNKMSKT